MSRSTIHTYICPCGQEFSGPVYDYVNVAREPRLRYIVLSGLLNSAMCPTCGRHTAVARPFIYSDPEYNLLIYVHPRANAPEKARQLILKRLRSVYVDVSCVREESLSGDNRVLEISSHEASVMPPLKVVFGFEQLFLFVNSVLKPRDRLGKLALSTHSGDSAERAQFFTIARKLAVEMNCTFKVEDFPREYTVRLYGARRNINSLMHSLTATF